MVRTTIIMLLGFAAAGCAAAQPSLPTLRAGTIGPRDAILLAADAAPKAVPGTFAMLVRATGRARGQVYLNSELDYRDQRNLTINIDPAAAEGLENRLGQAPDRFFKGKWVEVRGAAERVRIGFFDDHGRPTGLYYYQTHVRVRDSDQIVLAVPR
jgi:hypothetical protein